MNRAGAFFVALAATSLLCGLSSYARAAEDEITAQVVVLGFRVERPTWDDAWEHDGRGDEVRIEARITTI
jgi:hypothetical protein